MRTVVPLACLALLPALPGCYLSYSDLGDGGDGGTDGRDTPDDRADDGRDVDVADAPPPEWRFTDRAVPDLSIPVRLYFASVPSVAWNGRSAGLVYQGREPGADERINFIPLDARGNPTGPERTLWSGGGVHSPIPHIVADGDLFLVTFVTESGRDLLVLARVDPAGNLVEAMETPLESGVVEPVVPPVVLDEYLLVPLRTYGDDGRIRVLRVERGAFPGSRLFDVPLEDRYAGGPFVLAPGNNPGVAMLFYAAADGRIVGEEYTEGLVRTSTATVTVPAEFPPMDLVATRADDTYLFCVASPSSDGVVRMTTWSASRGLVTDEFPALFPGGLPAASGDPRPAWGATFALVEDDRWRVAAVVAAEPVGGTVVHLAVPVDDGVSPRRLDDMPRSGIAWTGNGFLVVWDEWREEASAYGIYASYLELHTVP
ncbi:MAG: hypothetical protein JXB32_03295 [Deltaproteobacteria bacterium]|nr:hypothetical protein [Deltaproteobacteria bacterium]